MTLWSAARQASLSITNSQSLLKLMSIEFVIPSNHLIFCHSLLSLPQFFFPSIMLFSNELVLCIRWSKYWSFSFSINLSNEYSELISFKIDWLDLPWSPRDLQDSPPAPQFKNIGLQHSAFSMVQLSHPYMTTGKTIALTLQTFVGKVMSLLFITLSRFVIAFPYVIACLLRGHNSTHCCEHLLFHLLQWEASPTSHQAPWGRTVQT